uniref:Uncharacterized protein n=1 Tax=Marseillevirus LCMAC201 TaxID=2506605 RepID=A0A481YWJ0_9VIRU|nr:MAG: hypothetical protein LCMAC201_02900 [Marseillevirus LCMAC201]
MIIYAVYVLGVIVILYFLINKEYARLDAGRVYKVKEAKQGVAIDKNYFYAISNSVIGKYLKKSGKRVLRKKLPFKHLNGGKIINGDLVVVNNPAGQPKDNAIVWIDPVTLNVIDIMQLPHLQGSLTWVDWHWDKWWICDAYYKKKVKNTTIYCFDQDWNPQGYWKLPKKVVESIEPYSLSGGAWFGEYLCVTGHDKPEMYILQMPADKVHAKLLKTVQICFNGQGFAFERGKGHLYAWGIRRNSVVRCSIDLEN